MTITDSLRGIAAGALTVGLAELASAVTSGRGAPLESVGQAFIERTPPWLKDFAVERFGTHDKTVLLGGITLAVLLLSAAAGVLARRRRAAGFGLVLALDAVALVAAITRPGAGPVDGLPILIGSAAGVLALAWLLRTAAPSLPDLPDGPDPSDGEPAGKHSARRAVLGLGVVGAGGIVALTAGRVLQGRALAGATAVPPLPAPARPAQPLPSGARLDVPGITPLVTPNADFYRIDTALSVPRLAARDWTLRIHGLVERELTLSYDDVRALPLVERTITLTCVSNEVGGTLAGNAIWLGHPLKTLLERAKPSPDADMVLSTSIDGFTVSTPLAALTDGRDALLAIGMNGAPLPADHGFPARLVVPGLYGYVSATKWVVDLEVTRFDRARAYWTDRGYAAQAPIRTASRIDVPRPFAQVRAGRVAVAGVAWAQRRGIERVEVRVDGEAWTPAVLAGGDTALDPLRDMWRQWVWTWDAAPGTHLLQVRATDGDGAVQPEERRRPAPDGATGWHSVSVTVTP